MNIKELNENLEYILESTKINESFNGKNVSGQITMEFYNDYIYCEVDVDSANTTVVIVEDNGDKFKVSSEIDPAGSIKYTDNNHEEYIVNFLDKTASLKELRDVIIKTGTDSVNQFFNDEDEYGRI